MPDARSAAARVGHRVVRALDHRQQRDFQRHAPLLDFDDDVVEVAPAAHDHARDVVRSCRVPILGVFHQRRVEIVEDEPQADPRPKVAVLRAQLQRRVGDRIRIASGRELHWRFRRRQGTHRLDRDFSGDDRFFGKSGGFEDVRRRGQRGRCDFRRSSLRRSRTGCERQRERRSGGERCRARDGESKVPQNAAMVGVGAGRRQVRETCRATDRDDSKRVFPGADLGEYRDAVTRCSCRRMPGSG